MEHRGRSIQHRRVSTLTGLSTHTLRFYEKEDLFLEPVRRDAAGRRRFSERDIDWIHMGVKLRSTGMPLTDIRRYVELVRDNSDTRKARLQLLRQHEDRVRTQLMELQAALLVIEAKVWSHQSHGVDSPSEERPGG